MQLEKQNMRKKYKLGKKVTSSATVNNDFLIPSPRWGFF